MGVFLVGILKNKVKILPISAKIDTFAAKNE